MYGHLVRNAGAASGIVAFSLLLGAVGYHGLEGMEWLDAFYTAAMILTGMGPTAPLNHASAKVFAIFYALFAAVVFLSVMTLLLAPMARRFLHRFRLEYDAGEEASSK
jgi:hypothetical protein